MITGEAAQNTQLLEAMQMVIAHMQEDSTFWAERAKDGPKVGLLVSEEPTCAAASGVAFRMRSQIDTKYCMDYFEK